MVSAEEKAQDERCQLTHGDDEDEDDVHVKMNDDDVMNVTKTLASIEAVVISV